MASNKVGLFLLVVYMERVFEKLILVLQLSMYYSMYLLQLITT